MAQSFPTELQSKFNEAGFTQQFGNSTIESKPDVGPVKKRRRYTTEYDEFSATIDMNVDDYAVLETFYKTTLAGGTLTFNFNHPFTGLVSEFQFIRPPTLSPIGGKFLRISFVWRELP